MPRLSMMIKPCSSSCNLNCKYCFYNSLSKQREIDNYGIMPIETLEQCLIKALEFCHGDLLYLCFHGGEPLLRGLSFYKEAINIINLNNKYDSQVIISFQTNGTLIDEDWAEFFYENDILVGVSLDGDFDRNLYRVDKDNNSTFEKVVHNIDLLKKHNVQFNILSVVTKDVAKNITSVYNFYKEKGYKYLQFTPCLKPFNQNNILDEDMYMTGEEYGKYLIDLTTLYINDYMKDNYISIRQIDNFVRLAAHQEASQCGMNGHCCFQYTIEADGSVFPCDYYVLDRYYLGNIKTSSIKDLMLNNIQQDFVLNSKELKDECKTCRYYALCKNGCKRERFDVDKCTAYKMYFDKMLKYLQYIGHLEFGN